MDAVLEEYLNCVDQHLKQISVLRRMDIVSDIKKRIIEMQEQNFNNKQILDKLGDPKDLAKSYVGDLGVTKQFNKNNFGLKILFYSLIALSGMIVIPCCFIIAIVFILCGVIIPPLAFIKMINSLFNLGIPYFNYVQITIGNIVFHPIFEFVVALVCGCLLIIFGVLSWKILTYFIRKVGEYKKKFSL